MHADPRWSASRIARIIEASAARRAEGAPGKHRDLVGDVEANDPAVPVTTDSCSLDELTGLDHHEFVDVAYRVILGRPPAANEHVAMLDSLLNGESKTWLLGILRYGSEGSPRNVAIPGLRRRYLAHRLFRTPGIGSVIEWVGGILSLPRSLRYLRASSQIVAGSVLDVEQELRAQAARHFSQTDDVHATPEPGTDDIDDVARLEALHGALLDEVGRLKHDLAMVTARADATRSRLEAILPPRIGDTLEVDGRSMLAIARDRAAIPADMPTSKLSAHARYALFELAFYESTIVLAKQRVYLPYIARELTALYPFLDLGCGRGEFLRILRESGIDAIGIDSNPFPFDALRAEGFVVIEDDILRFLEAERRTFSGASILQVAEHFTSESIERMLALVAPRLAPGAPLIVETPNPLCPFALGRFHTDPTHVAPLPPERLRFAIEAAGFERARTLFQARTPDVHYLGADPLAYYMDYAIIAYRSAA